MSVERELREVLRAKAASFAPTLRPQASVIRRARTRAARRLTTAALVIAGAALVGTSVASRLTPSQRAFAAVTVSARVHEDDRPARGHSVTGGGPSHADGQPGAPVTLAMLERNVRCMRAHGFDLPDPVATRDGWQVIVEDGAPLPSESPDYAVRRRWAQAVFVDCRLMDVGNDLVVGGRTRPQIDRLIACVRSKGFALPAPTETTPGEFVFDLADATPAWGSRAWYETVFVTCGLWQEHHGFP